MNDKPETIGTGPSENSETKSQKKLTPEAMRALKEAEERRKQADKRREEQPPEKGGRDGPDPVRFGDWEKDGIISDF
jgi:hypothetical protein